MVSSVRFRHFGPMRWTAVVVFVVALASPIVVHIWISMPLLLLAIFLFAVDNSRRGDSPT